MQEKTLEYEETTPLLTPNEQNKDSENGPQVIFCFIVQPSEQKPKNDASLSDIKPEKLQRLKTITQKAQEIYESEEQKRQKKTEKEPIKNILFRYTSKSDHFMIFCAYFAAFTSGLLVPTQQICFGVIIDEFSQPEINTFKIFQIGAILFVISIVIFILITIWYYILELQSILITRKFKIEYLSSLLKQDVRWFDEQNAQELQSKMSQEIYDISKVTGKLMGLNIFVLGLSVFGFIYAFFSSVLLTTILLLYFPLFFLITAKVRKASSVGVVESQQAYSQSAGFADQALNSIKVVTAFGQEYTEIENFNLYLQKAQQIQYSQVSNISKGYALFNAAAALYMLYSFSFLALFVLQEWTNINTGEPYDPASLYVVQSITAISLFSFLSIFPNVRVLVEGQISAKQAFKILNSEPRIKIQDPSKANVSEIEDFKGRIEFRNVTFQYKNATILKNFSAVFEEGKTTAIVGRSGAGKSTIISLIERFYDVDEGEILIDGINVKDLNLDDFRKAVGYVGQEPVLFNTTIRKNMQYANPHATDQEIIRALRFANAYKFIESDLPNGIDTQVGNAGSQISGGQKQRIALARAFIKNSRILLLDEATSALDSKNEKDVQEAIEKISKGLGSITTVVVAHRLSTVKNADKILVLSEGEIVEMGNHDELLSNYPEGIYSHMVQEQSKALDISNDNIQPPLISRLSKKLSRNSSIMHDSLRSLQLQNEINEAEQDYPEVINSYSIVEKCKRLLVLSNTNLIVLAVIATFLLAWYFPFVGINQTNALYILEGTADVDNQGKAISICLCIFLILVFYFGIFRYITKSSQTKIGAEVSTKIRSDLYTSILSKSMYWFDRRRNSPGNLTTILSKDATVIKAIGSESLQICLEFVFTLITTVVVAMIFCWQIALSALLFYPFMVFVIVNMQIQQRKVDILVNAQAAEANLLSGDFIINNRTVASFSNQETMVKDYEDFLTTQSYELKSKVFFVSLSFAGFRFGIMLIYSLVMILSSLLLMYNPDLDTQDVFTSMLVILLSFIGIGTQSAFFGDVVEASASSERIFNIIDEPSEINPLMDSENPVKYKYKQVPLLKEIKGEIEFRNVWFRYPNRPEKWVLKNFSIKISPNQSVALVGESGCGKSTIVQLLLRFYDINAGEILIDNLNIQDYPIGDLRRYMGLVMQEPSLFTYTLYENILYGNGLASNSEISEAASKAYVMEFIDRFKEENDISGIYDSYTLLREELEELREHIINLSGSAKYEMWMREVTRLEKEEIEQKGSLQGIEGAIDFREQHLKDRELQAGFYKNCGLKGNKLSGGQKQRVAIARAILRKPQILLLDEATSSLDEESQAIVQKAIEELMNERTTIVIAHRLSTVEKCQRIVMLKDGQVVEQGTIKELKNDPNSYYNAFASEMNQTRK